jgi:hypothetical protein
LLLFAKQLHRATRGNHSDGNYLVFQGYILQYIAYFDVVWRTFELVSSLPIRIATYKLFFFLFPLDTGCRWNWKQSTRSCQHFVSYPARFYASRQHKSYRAKSSSKLYTGDVQCLAKWNVSTAKVWRWWLLARSTISWICYRRRNVCVEAVLLKILPTTNPVYSARRK